MLLSKQYTHNTYSEDRDVDLRSVITAREKAHFAAFLGKPEKWASKRVLRSRSIAISPFEALDELAGF